MADLTKIGPVTKSLTTEQKVDVILGDLVDAHPELEKVKKNTKFMKKLRDTPIQKDEKKVKILGFYNWDPYHILKLNIWDRSIYATDHLSRLFLSGAFEMQKKYLAKKRTLGFDFKIFLIIALCIGGGLVALLLILKMKGGI